MAITEADICNRALLRVGQKELIASLTDAPFTAQACAVLYPQARDEVLAEFPWPFACRHAVLAPLTLGGAPQYTVTRSGWQSVYLAPGDMISARYIFGGARPGALIPSSSSALTDAWSQGWVNPPLSTAGSPLAFSVEAADDGSGSLLLTDQQSPELVYTARVTIPIAFPPLFVSALAWRLATDLALALPVKDELADWARKQYLAELARAGAAAFRGEQEDSQADSEFIGVRG